MTTMLADPPRKTTMGVGFEANRGRSGDPQAWKKAIGTKPVAARLALLPDSKPRWDRIGLSAAGQLAIVAAFLPSAYALRLTWTYRQIFLVGGSAMIVLIGTAWFVERSFDVRFLFMQTA